MSATEQRQDWFLSSEIANGDPEKSRFHVIPVPFEETVSYGGGTAEGPEAIIAASSQLELWDGGVSVGRGEGESDGESDGEDDGEDAWAGGTPADSGIHTWDMIRRLDFETVPDYFERTASVAAIALDLGAIPVILGGEHSITFAPVSACREKYGEIGVVQFDAHADLRKTYEGSPYSHACVMRRIVDELQLPIFQVGLRGISQEENRFIAEHRIPGLAAEEAVVRQVSELRLPEDFPEKVYITIDVDGLDPSIMPATGTPVPGGLGWYQLMGMLKSIAAQRTIVGFDVVELAPISGLHYCEFTAARLVYALMGLIGAQIDS